MLAISEFASRPYHTEEPEKSVKKGDSQYRVQPRRSWFSSAAPLGSLIFSLLCYLADASTLVAWSWTGYPIKGPVPHIHWPLTIVAQAIGLLLGVLSTGGVLESILGHPCWLAVGALSTYILHGHRNWIGYSGGLIFSIFWMSMIPRVLLNASKGVDTLNGSGTAQVYFGTFFILILLLLANVWTVAYAFVPGGIYLRERTDL